MRTERSQESDFLSSVRSPGRLPFCLDHTVSAVHCLLSKGIDWPLRFSFQTANKAFQVGLGRQRARWYIFYMKLDITLIALSTVVVIQLSQLPVSCSQGIARLEGPANEQMNKPIAESLHLFYRKF